MKIVKFKNGKYGVRKWSWIFGRLFAINKSGVWKPKNDVWIQEFDSLEYAKEVLADMEQRKSVTKDTGMEYKPDLTKKDTQ